MTTTILADGQAPNVVSQQILDAVNNGALLVNYTGHGSEEQWSFADLMDDTSAGALTNGGRLPVFLLMDCLNGFFHDVYATSLSTSLLMAPNGGAVAVWASSGFTTAPPQASMDQALLRTLAANPSLPLGQAILKAKSNITDPDVRRTWILFGDPAMVVAFPNTPAAHHARKQTHVRGIAALRMSSSVHRCPNDSAAYAAAREMGRVIGARPAYNRVRRTYGGFRRFR